MREKRRLALASRQLMLAQIARREAMSALASAVEEENRSTALAQRTRALLRDYGTTPPSPDAGALREYAAFVRSLEGVARQADAARRDAVDQAQWQIRSLAAADTRAARVGERHEEAMRALQAVIARREQAHPAMAHKLQNNSHEAATSRPAARHRKRP